MEDILEVYKRPYSPEHPVICFDETNRQLIAETRVSIPAEAGKPKKIDYEYRRNGVGNIFMIFEPLQAKRYVKTSEKRTSIDFAHCIQDIVDVHYPDAEKSMEGVVCALCTLVSYLKSNSIGSLRIDPSILKPASRGRKILPYFTRDEVLAILGAIDRSTDEGVRDYAVVMLAANTALRAVDIRKLKLTDIDWETYEITIIQSKTAGPLEFPSATLRELGKYQMAMGLDAYVLPREMIGNPTKFIPYLFSDDEMKVLFETIDTIGSGKTRNSSSRGLVLPVVYRMLYCCGLRPGEPLRLKRDDVNLNNGELFIRNSKNGKDRIVMMSDELLEMSSRYDSLMGKRDYFFQSPGYGVYRPNWLRTNLHKCWEASGLDKGVKQPRVYDFRHAFCVHSLEKMLSQGIPYDAALPVLCAYMGHSSLSATTKYLHLTQELYPEISQRLERATGSVIPDMEGIGNENE